MDLAKDVPDPRIDVLCIASRLAIGIKIALRYHLCSRGRALGKLRQSMITGSAFLGDPGGFIGRTLFWFEEGVPLAPRGPLGRGREVHAERVRYIALVDPGIVVTVSE